MNFKPFEELQFSYQSSPEIATDSPPRKTKIQFKRNNQKLSLFELILFYRWKFGVGCFSPECSQGIRLAILSAITVTAQVENQGIIKDSVQGTEQRIVLVEVLLPLRRLLVAGKNHCVRSFLIVAPVNEVEEHPCVLPIKDTMTNLINNQAGRFHKVGDDSSAPSIGTSLCKHVVQF